MLFVMSSLLYYSLCSRFFMRILLRVRKKNGVGKKKFQTLIHSFTTYTHTQWSRRRSQAERDKRCGWGKGRQTVGEFHFKRDGSSSEPATMEQLFFSTFALLWAPSVETIKISHFTHSMIIQARKRSSSSDSIFFSYPHYHIMYMYPQCVP